MGKKNKFMKVVGMVSVVLVGNTTLATAENAPDADRLDESRNLTASNNRGLALDAESHSLKLSNKPQELTNFDDIFSQVSSKQITSGQIAQATNATPTKGTTADIIKPAQESIPNTDNLNPSSNPLSFPTKSDEVEVDPQKPITLEQAIELSLKNNKQIEEARTQVERAQAVVTGSKAALFPTAILGSELTYGNSGFLDSQIEQSIEQNADAILENANISDPTAEQEEQARSQAEGSVSSTTTSSLNFATDVTLRYDIYDGGARGAAISRDEKLLRTRELSLEQIVEQTRLETSSNYYDLQNSDAQVKIQEAAVSDASQTLKDAKLLEKAGLGTRFDVLRAEVELAQAQQELSTARANQNITRRQLAETLSVSHSTDLSTADAIKEVGVWKFSLPESIVQAFKNRAELEQLLLQREIGAEERKLALSSIRPTLSTTARYGISNDFEDEIGTSDQYSVGVNLQWALFDGGAARAGALQAEKDIEIADTQFANQRNEIRFAVEQAYFGLESNQRNIATSTKEVELAAESLRLARLRFQAGVGTQTDVIDSQTQLTTARGNLLSSIIQYNQSYTTLAREVSNTPDNGLQDLP